MSARDDLLVEMKAKAMSEEGISDEEMASYLARQKELMRIAETEGGPAAIRSAMKPRGKPKAMPAVTREELVGPPSEAPVDPMIAANQGANAEILNVLKGIIGGQPHPGGDAIMEGMVAPQGGPAPMQNPMMQAPRQPARPLMSEPQGEATPPEAAGILDFLRKILSSAGQNQGGPIDTSKIPQNFGSGFRR